MKIKGLNFRRLFFYLIGVAVAIVLPWILSGVTGGDFYLHLIVMIMIMSILAMSFNILTGYTGRANLAHASFMGVGAYTSTLLVMEVGVPYWVAFLAGGIMAIGIGLVIAIPTLKLRGHYFAIGTIALAQFITMVFINTMPGGSDGIPDVPNLTLWGIDFTIKLNYVYLMIFWAAVIFFITSRVINSRLGRAFIAIREGEDLAMTTGVDVTRYKILAFMISAFIAGLAGALYAPYMHYICPEDFGLLTLMSVLAMTAVGGFGTLWGPFVGTTILTLLPEILLPLKDYIFIIYGLMLIPIIIYAPKGIMGSVQGLLKRRAAARRAKGLEV
ncbi:hypothetical protein ES703_61631 [subsurface metagenome]